MRPSPSSVLTRLVRRAEARRAAIAAGTARVPFRRSAAVAVAALALTGPAAAQQTVIPQGGEFRVNTRTSGSQLNPVVARDAAGNSVVVWQSGDGDNYGVYAQRYAASGAAVGGEFRVNTYTASVQREPSVAMDADGDFVVAWESFAQDGQFGGIYAQRYDASGVPAGEFRVNTTTASAQTRAAVAMDDDGAFVVVWVSEAQDGSNYGVFARRYTASGTPAGGEFQVNTFTTQDQNDPAVAMDADGDFVVAWESRSQEGYSNYGVFAQRYAASGTRAGGEFHVNTFTTNNQSEPSVAMDADGDFVVAWQSRQQDVPGPYGFGYGVYAQRYVASGAAQGGEFRVNTTVDADQLAPSVAMDADGDAVVAWVSYGQDGSYGGIYAQRYAPSGAAVGGEFLVNTYTNKPQTDPAVAMDADGDVVVAWESFGQDDPGNNGYGVFAQRFEGPNRPVASGGQTAIELRGTPGYRMLAAPTAGLTLGAFLGPLWTQGFPDADTPNGGANVYRYDEATPGNQNLGYVTPTSANEVMPSGRGYFVNVYEDDDPRASAPGIQGGFPKTLTATGGDVAGPVSLPLTYTDNGDASEDGWNLVGNPYRTSIDWDLVAKTDLNLSVYVYDDRADTYRVYNSGIGDLERGVIAAGQGFWVQAMDTDASGTVTPSASVPVGAQVMGDGQFYGRPGSGGETMAETQTETPPHVAFSLVRGAGGAGNEATAFVTFSDAATPGLDAFDAAALTPSAARYTQLSTVAADGSALAIQALPLAAATLALDAGSVEDGAPAGGAFVLAWEAASLPDGLTARLVDAETGASHDLAAAGRVAFEIAAPAGRGSGGEAPAEAGPPRLVALRSSGASRFTVVVEARAVGTEDEAAAPFALGVAPNPVASGGTVRLSIPMAGPVRVAVYDALGRVVAVLADGERAAGEHALPLGAERFAPGVYVVRVTAGTTQLVRRVSVAR